MAMPRRIAFVIIVLVLLFSAVSGTLFVRTAEGSCVSKAPMHEARSGLGVAVIKGKIYAIGGIGEGGVSSTNEEYDPATDAWTFKAPMPTPRSYFGIAVWQNKIYCIGGTTGFSSDAGFATAGVNEVYDPASDTWEIKAPMPTPRFNLQAAVVEGKIYLIGGVMKDPIDNITIPHKPNYGKQFSNVVEVYDPVTDSWTIKASMPTAASSYASAVVDNKIYVITSNLNQIYYAENDSWSLGAKPLLPMFSPSAGTTTGELAPQRIYVFGPSSTDWQSRLPELKIQSYDPKTNSWMVYASVPTGRFGMGVAVLNDKLYVIGGYTLAATKPLPFNPVIAHSAVNEQYTPVGYGAIDLSYVPQSESNSLELIVLSPENKTYTTNNVSLIFTVNKTDLWMGYILDSGDNVTINGNTTIAGLGKGLHSVIVYAKDDFGNIAASETATFIIIEKTEIRPEPEQFPTSLITVASTSMVGVAASFMIRLKKRNNQISQGNFITIHHLIARNNQQRRR